MCTVWFYQRVTLMILPTLAGNSSQHPPHTLSTVVAILFRNLPCNGVALCLLLLHFPCSLSFDWCFIVQFPAHDVISYMTLCSIIRQCTVTYKALVELRVHTHSTCSENEIRSHSDSHIVATHSHCGPPDPHQQNSTLHFIYLILHFL